MKKLSIFMSYFGFGGAEKNAILMANQLNAKNIDVELVVIGDADGALASRLDPGVTVVNLNVEKVGQTLNPLIAYLQKRQPDALQARIWPMTVIAVLAAKLSRQKIRVVCSEHTVLSISNIGKSFKNRVLIRLTTALAYRLAHARFGVSQGVADDMAKMALMPRTRFDVINNASSPIPAKITPSEEQSHFAKERKIILAVGTLKAVKGFGLLIQAAAHLSQHREDFCVAIIGEGQERTRLEALITEHDLGETVTLFGFRKDVNKFYKGADVFALTSHLEGFVNVVVEALAFGLTIVSVDCPTGPQEILKGGEFGTLVEGRNPKVFSKALDHALDNLADPEHQTLRPKDFHIDKITQKYMRALNLAD